MSDKTNSELGIGGPPVLRRSGWSADLGLQAKPSTGPGMPGAPSRSPKAGNSDRPTRAPKKAKGWSAR
jgi:hypothetical protein